MGAPTVENRNRYVGAAIGRPISLRQVSFTFHSLLSSPDGRYFCSVERKSNQKRPLPLRSERTKNHRRPLDMSFGCGDKRGATILFCIGSIGDF